DKTIILWKVNQLNQIGTRISPGMEGEVWALASAPDGGQFAAGDAAGNIRIWAFDGGQLTHSVSLTHPGGVLALAFSHDNKWLASAGYKDTIRVWNLETDQEAWTIENAHTDAIWALIFNPEDTQLASASYDKTVKLWDTAAHQQVGKSLEHEDPMYTLAFNQDGTQLLAAGLERTIYLWDVTNPASPPTPRQLVGHTAVVNSLGFNPIYPSLFASTSDDKTLVIWNVDADEHTEPVLGLNESMEAVTFSPNGQWLASATNNNTVLLWELDSERCSKTWDKDTCQPNRLGTPLVGHNAQVQNVVFLSDTALVSSSADGQMILWNLDKSFWYKHACDIVNRGFSTSEYRQYIENRINLGLLNVFSWFADLFGAKRPPLEAPYCISSD
ncbi:MAG TPA: WD40 repeat domain-containing protein, partial [Anaerolineales bacterium]|nr:WD40 repeat domain-containing protein [Anaerolineales bacterium]